MNKIVLSLGLIICFLACSSQKKSTNKIQESISEFITDSCFYAAGIGIVVSNTENGEIIAEHNAKMALTPASSQKLITTSTALAVLGADYQFKTTIITDGEIINGNLYGNLIIKGFGDPSLESKYIESPESFSKQIIKQLSKLNITTIHGSVIIDNSYFKSSIPATWIWEDIGNYYGTVPNALNYRDNAYTLFFESEKAGTKAKLIKTEPAFTGLEFDNQIISSTIERDLAYIFGGNTSKQRRIEGSIPQNRKEFRIKGAILDPKVGLLEDIKAELKLSNIHILNRKIESQKNHQEIDTIYSPNLSELIYQTNQKSINLFADQLLFEIGKKQLDNADWDSGIKAINEFWQSKNIETKYQKMLDGSGLSHFNAISAEFFNQILNYMYHSNDYNVFLKSLPVAGESGTLKYFGNNSVLKSKWMAKTGSMNGVRSYCGYLNNSKGETYSVCILINNYHCSSNELNNKLLKLLITIYNS